MAGPSRGESQDFDSDIDDAELNGEDGAPGKPGRKKNPNSQAARRDQNRIAQREFRLRKQQRIRDLEARVELLSGNKEEIVYEMRMMLKDLMDENAALRNLVKGLSAFVGDGAGGILQKIGWNHDEFNDFVNKNTSDLAYESFQKHKATAAKRRASEPSAPEPSNSNPNKRARADSDQYGNNSGMFRPVQPAPAGGSSGSGDTSLFSQLVRGNNNAHMYPPAGPQPPTYGAGPSGNSPSYNLGGSYGMSPLSMEVPSPAGSGSVGSGPGYSHMSQPDPREAEVDPKVDEAGKLINYHLDNYSRNSNYHLPASLRPTDIQQKITHSRCIDAILIPAVRNLMILLQDKFDMAEALVVFMHSVTVHGEDGLSHTNWEIGERFLYQFPMLVDQSVLDITNRWRRERGEKELTLEDIGPDSQRSRARP